jgi:hypothetical protein
VIEFDSRKMKGGSVLCGFRSWADVLVPVLGHGSVGATRGTRGGLQGGASVGEGGRGAGLGRGGGDARAAASAGGAHGRGKSRRRKRRGKAGQGKARTGEKEG